MNAKTSPMTRSWFTAKELAGLPGMPGTVQGVNARAKAQSWEAQKRMGRGGGYEFAFAVLPAETQNALIAQAVGEPEPHTVEAEPAPEPQAETTETRRLTDTQRRVMAARVAFVREIQRMSQMVSQQRAIQTLVALAEEGDLTPYLAERASIANDRKTETRTLSERTLKRWVSAFKKHGEAGLAPKRRKADMSMPPWAGDFLKRYQRPQKPSVEAAYQQLVEQTEPPHPSIHQVRRFLAKLTPEARERGRMGPRELKALQPFKRRKSDGLFPNDVWVADGHTFDAEVINPLTGQAFRPEVTLIIDWGTRRIVGFAINLAESTLATLDALRDAVSRAGMFNLFYVDNGSGFANESIYEVVDRLGGTITHSLPYNSQARGVIERAHQSTLVRLAKTMPSYIGADMDPEAAGRAHKLSRRDIAQGLKPAQLPTFQEFFDRLNEALDAYNHRPHKGLPKIRDLETGRMRHRSPMEAWKSAEAEGFEALTAPAEVIATLMRPQETRKTHRGEVRYAGNLYFLRELNDFHGEEVKVAWDYRDASAVGVYTLEGEWIGEAVLDGNATDAMPQTMIQRAAEKRERGQLNRLQKKAKTITGQEVEIRTVEPAPRANYSEQKLEAARAKARELAAPQEDRFEIPRDPTQRYRLWQRLDARQAQGEPLGEQEKAWWQSYPKTTGFRAIQRVMDAEGQPSPGTRRAM
ncbi:MULTISPECIES: DNA-binding protein [Halomonas]|uniref:Transposase n=1 Tax=Halomonas halophila TaxID=29573 RepID=A0ABQ0TZJ8_9GAMM|nr:MULTISPECIES: DNA-binding protein [Halomonas]MDR5889670.1 DNA-binding protein [Halomonas salina]WJY06352.1 DNA-binding protein [Halomonas halophila]GEK71561.1 transposase [Halomonas halophila]